MSAPCPLGGSGAPTRRALLGASLAGPAVGLMSGGLVRPASAGYAGPIVDWIDRRARRLRGIDPGLPDSDLAPLRGIVGPARLVGLGEASHGTHDLFVLKHRVARFLVERLGFRTIAWEEAWASGLQIDRYVTRGEGDPMEIARQTTYHLQYEALVDLMRWMRQFNEHRPRGDQVRFAGADVIQLRQLQYDELERYVADVAPDRLTQLREHLDPLRIQTTPGAHVGAYRSLSPEEQHPLIEHARAVDRLVCRLPGGTSSVDRFEARMHALTLRGFYEAYGPGGEETDVRARYVVAILDRWLATHPRPAIYSAANAHTVAWPRQIVSMPHPHAPPDAWVTPHSLAGGILRSRYGSAYVSIGTSFTSGSMLSGWAEQDVREYDVPRPDRKLRRPCARAGAVRRLPSRSAQPRIPPTSGPGLAGLARHHPELRRRLLRPEPGDDYYIAAQRWGHDFDGLLHLDTVTPGRLLEVAAK